MSALGMHFVVFGRVISGRLRGGSTAKNLGLKTEN